MKQHWLQKHSPEQSGLHLFRYEWESDRANGNEETELIFSNDGRLLGIDYRPSFRPKPVAES